MSAKSRGNYKITFCIKSFECKNKDNCQECIKFNKYKKNE